MAFEHEGPWGTEWDRDKRGQTEGQKEQTGALTGGKGGKGKWDKISNTSRTNWGDKGSRLGP